MASQGTDSQWDGVDLAEYESGSHPKTRSRTRAPAAAAPSPPSVKPTRRAGPQPSASPPPARRPNWGGRLQQAGRHALPTSERRTKRVSIGLRPEGLASIQESSHEHYQEMKRLKFCNCSGGHCNNPAHFLRFAAIELPKQRSSANALLEEANTRLADILVAAASGNNIAPETPEEQRACIEVIFGVREVLQAARQRVLDAETDMAVASAKRGCGQRDVAITNAKAVLADAWAHLQSLKQDLMQQLARLLSMDEAEMLADRLVAKQLEAGVKE